MLSFPCRPHSNCSMLYSIHSHIYSCVSAIALCAMVAIFRTETRKAFMYTHFTMYSIVQCTLAGYVNRFPFAEYTCTEYVYARPCIVSHLAWAFSVHMAPNSPPHTHRRAHTSCIYAESSLRPCVPCTTTTCMIWTIRMASGAMTATTIEAHQHYILYTKSRYDRNGGGGSSSDAEKHTTAPHTGGRQAHITKCTFYISFRFSGAFVSVLVPVCVCCRSAGRLSTWKYFRRQGKNVGAQGGKGRREQEARM